MTKEEFYTKWQPNGFYAHNPVEFMTDLESVIKTEQSLQAAVSGSLPLPELVKELGECLEQSSVLIDFGAARCQDDFSVPAHLQRVKEARQLYKFYKESGGNDH